MLRRLSLDCAPALLALASFAAGCSKGAPPPPPRAVPVDIAAIEKRAVPVTSEYLATIKSRHAVAISPQVDGFVTEIRVRSGDRVKEGAVLMVIDPRKQQATVHTQSNTLRARRAALDYARRSYERTNHLYKRDYVSHDDLDRAREALDSAAADYRAQEAALKQQEVELRYYSVKAPSDGIVGDVPARVGDRVAQTTVLTTVDSNQRLELYVAVPLERAGQLHLGLPIEVLDGKGKLLAKSQVHFIAPRVDDATQSVLVKTYLDPEVAAGLRTAQFVRARLVWETREGPVIPATAVSRLNEQTFAFAVEEHDGKEVARRKPIRVGALVDNRYLITDGLKPGDKVVLSGIQKLADGVPVTAAKPPVSGDGQTAEAKPGDGEDKSAEAKPAPGGGKAPKPEVE